MSDPSLAGHNLLHQRLAPRQSGFFSVFFRFSKREAFLMFFQVNGYSVPEFCETMDLINSAAIMINPHGSPRRTEAIWAKRPSTRNWHICRFRVRSAEHLHIVSMFNYRERYVYIYIYIYVCFDWFLINVLVLVIEFNSWQRQRIFDNRNQLLQKVSQI